MGYNIAFFFPYFAPCNPIIYPITKKTNNNSIYVLQL
jgi:hypothetical protein